LLCLHLLSLGCLYGCRRLANLGTGRQSLILSLDDLYPGGFLLGSSPPPLVGGSTFEQGLV
jgi:hypothetical protein